MTTQNLKFKIQNTKFLKIVLVIVISCLAVVVFINTVYTAFNFYKVQTPQPNSIQNLKFKIQNSGNTDVDESFKMGLEMFEINKKMLEQLKLIRKDMDNLEPSLKMLKQQYEYHKLIHKELLKQIKIKNDNMKLADEGLRLGRKSAKIQADLYNIQLQLYNRQLKSQKLSSAGLKKARKLLSLAKETNALGEKGIDLPVKMQKYIKKMFGFGF